MMTMMPSSSRDRLMKQRMVSLCGVAGSGDGGKNERNTAVVRSVVVICNMCVLDFFPLGERNIISRTYLLWVFLVDTYTLFTVVGGVLLLPSLKSSKKRKQ